MFVVGKSPWLPAESRLSSLRAKWHQRRTREFRIPNIQILKRKLWGDCDEDKEACVELTALEVLNHV